MYTPIQHFTGSYAVFSLDEELVSQEYWLLTGTSPWQLNGRRRSGIRRVQSVTLSSCLCVYHWLMFEQQFTVLTWEKSKESTERSYSVHTTHPQRNVMVTWLGSAFFHTQPERLICSLTHTHTLTHSLFILKDSLYSRLHSVILKAREAKRGEVTAT